MVLVLVVVVVLEERVDIDRSFEGGDEKVLFIGFYVGLIERENITLPGGNQEVMECFAQKLEVRGRIHVLDVLYGGDMLDNNPF